jgi:beta-1,2-mannobiose phosphorylase / 1,2-beta-oligomannan phosphorylase
VEFRNDSPVLFSEDEYDSHGLEDPRIVKIEDTYYLTYTAYDGINALGAYATSTDLIQWKKNGILVPKITYDAFKHFIELAGTINDAI